MKIFFGIVIGLVIFVVLFSVCFGLSAAFWRLVDRIFGWGEFSPRRSRQADREEGP